MMTIPEFAKYVKESLENVDSLSKEDILEELYEYLEFVETDLETMLIDFLIELVEEDKLPAKYMIKLFEMLEEYEEEYELDENEYEGEIQEESVQLNELGKIKRVVRNGKLIKRRFCPKGYKLEKGRCVRMSGTERMKLRRAAIRRARKMKAKRMQILRKRKLSMKRRRAAGLK